MGLSGPICPLPSSIATAGVAGEQPNRQAKLAENDGSAEKSGAEPRKTAITWMVGPSGSKRGRFEPPGPSSGLRVVRAPTACERGVPVVGDPADRCGPPRPDPFDHRGAC